LAYHEISIMDVWDVIRRWHDGQNISQIARTLSYDRKTVRCYVRLAHICGLSPDTPLPPKDEALRLLEEKAESSPRPSIAQALLMPFLDEIKGLINDPQLGLTAKSAFHVICQSHDLAGKVSYTSFKRFVRTHAFTLHPERLTCRIELPPGEEVQIDYCLITMMFDPQEDRRRKLYAFIGTLSHSRLKYVELTFSQDQVSFACSHIRMFEFFGGVPKRIIIDNLKSGVIKTDLYDPTLNRTYREMAEHVGTFIDAARIVHPKDKGKVERDTRTVRDAARTKIVLSPTASLGELNHQMREWSLKEYGLRLHGTTHEKPFVVFTEREKPALNPLPAAPFDITTWKQATVHPDRHIQYKRKIYNVPDAYCGKQVWIRATEHILQVFYKDKLIKQHAITGAYRNTDYNDFPENVRAVLDTSYIHRTLLSRAEAIGPLFHGMIRRLLEFHAYVNLRTAMALTNIGERSDKKLIERAASFLTDNDIKPTPRDLRSILDKLSRMETEPPLPFSEDSREFIRDITYFIKDQGEAS
jgi:transposase